MKNHNILLYYEKAKALNDTKVIAFNDTRVIDSGDGKQEVVRETHFQLVGEEIVSDEAVEVLKKTWKREGSSQQMLCKKVKNGNEQCSVIIRWQ